ncbi:MAG: GGDEF domain-containing protein [Clostridiaceae bacterium]|nr:GGDEF domain-containing protein [Clostridiaceae bacterium]
MKGDRKKIGICVAMMQSDIRQDQIQAICEYAKERHYDVLIFNVFTKMDNMNSFARGEAQILDMIPLGKLSALIMFTESFRNIEITRKIIERAQQREIPVISVDYQMQGCWNIMFAYVESFEAIVRHVIEYHGCKKVNFMAGFEDNEFSDARISCCQKVMQENGLVFEKDRLAYGQFWEMPTRKNCERWVKMWEDGEQERPEAIICANDIMALTVCNVLQNHGIRIPDDVIVTGFDGLELEKYCTPRLTLARDDLNLIGEEFLNIVDQCVSTETQPYDVKIPFLTVFSESCGCRPIKNCNPNEQIMYLYGRAAEMRIHTTDRFLMMSELTDGYSAVEMAQKLKNYEKMLGVDSAMIFLNRTFYAETDIPCSNSDQDFMILMAQVCQGEYTVQLHEIPYHGEYDAMQWLFDEVGLLMFIPLHCQDEIYGFIAVSYEEVSKDMGAFYEFILCFDQVLGTIRRQSQLHKMHITDMLTGLNNRRGFFQMLEQKIESLKGKQKMLFLASVDMDGLKFINDNYGHPEGDFSIREVARLLRESVEGEDGICARFGGDEYMVAVITEENKANIDFYQKFQELLEKRIGLFNRQAGKPYRLGVSIGSVYRVLSDKNDVDVIMKQADDIMYECKSRHHMSRTARQRETAREKTKK